MHLSNQLKFRAFDELLNWRFGMLFYKIKQMFSLPRYILNINLISKVITLLMGYSWLEMEINVT